MGFRHEKHEISWDCSCFLGNFTTKMGIMKPSRMGDYKMISPSKN